MSRLALGRSVAIAAEALAIFFFAVPAAAQPVNPPDGFAVGEFWFRPRIEVRLRGEYDHHPVTTSGETPVSRTELGVPIEVRHEWAAHERTRLGVAVDRGPVSAAVVVQDARVAGFPSPTQTLENGSSTTAFHAAYVEVHSSELHPSFVRLGQQEVSWGEGRILGVSDWLLVPRSLDAARARWTLRQLDLEALVAVLAPPGNVPLEYSGAAQVGGSQTGTGAQLYGLDTALHLDPLFSAEAMGLARIARTPVPASLTPSDTFLLDARLYGDRTGLSYAAEFAYELGRVAVIGSNRNLAAWAATAHIDWQSGWLWRPKFSLSGSYATGSDGQPSEATHRFDPILPDARTGLGQMGLYAWSNIADAALTITASPLDEMTFSVDYRYVRVADPRGAWFSASLLPVGQNRNNGDAFLGQEVDAFVSYAPLAALTLSAGYGGFFTGPGARAILSGQPDGGPTLLSVAFVQLSVMAP